MLTASQPKTFAALKPQDQTRGVAKQSPQDEARSRTHQATAVNVPPASKVGPPADPRANRNAIPANRVQGVDNSSMTPRNDPSITLGDSNTISQPTITREMESRPISEVLNHLSEHGCKNVTDQLDESNFSRYPISAGGYGDVYRGAFRNGSQVAVKCLRLHADSSEESKKQLKRAAREMYVWSKCNHPNVLGLTGVAQYRDQIAMVSPWMEYGNIRRMLSLKPEVDRYRLCAQVAEGVVYLHSVGVIHGDLKGDNILVSSDLTPKLTDFGNAALREYTLQFSNTTSRAGTSLNWVAPEVLGEETGLTTEADVYSLGMTMLEIVTGAIPYAGMREFIIVKKITSGVHPTRPEEQIPPNDHHSNLLWSLLTSCWAYSAEDRPTPVEVLDKVKEVISERESSK